MKSVVDRRELWLKKCVAIAVTVGMCFGGVAEAGEVVNIDTDINGTVYGNGSGENHTVEPPSMGVKDVCDYKVNMLPGSRAQKVYGAYRWGSSEYNDGFNINNNNVLLDNTLITGAVSPSVSAAYVGLGYGNANRNSVNITKSVESISYVCGVYGYGGGGTYYNNSAEIKDGDINSVSAVKIYLESKRDGTASVDSKYNTVKAYSGNIENVYGSSIGSLGGVMVGVDQYPINSANIVNSNNIILLEGNTNANRVVASDAFIQRKWSTQDSNSYKMTSSDNTVILKDNVHSEYVRASDSHMDVGNVIANNNTITLEDNVVVSGSIISGSASTSNGSAQANNNTISITGGTVDQHFIAGSSSGRGIDNRIYDITSDNNSVSVNPTSDVNIDGIDSGNAYGYVGNNTTIKISASKNRVSFTGGHVGFGGIHGGYSLANKTWGIETSEVSNATIDVSASNNTVMISGGTIAGSVTGGNAKEILLGPNNDINVTAANNTVVISGGTIAGSVYGAEIQCSNYPNATYEVKNNIVSWSGGIIDGFIVGDYKYLDGSLGGDVLGWDDTVTNSTFNFYASSEHANKSILGIGNFKNYNFYLDDTVLPNTTLINVASSVDLSKSNIGVARTATSPLNRGDRITLLATEGLITAPNISNDPTHMEGYAGNARSGNIYDVYDFDLINENGKNLVASLGKITPNEHPAIIPESRQPEIAFLDDKLDIVDYAYQTSVDKSEPVVFIDFNYMDVKKGEWNLRGSDMVVGQAYTKHSSDRYNSITQGPFFEYGDNSYSGTNFYNSGDVDGSGKVKKYGAGYLFRQVKSGRHHIDAYVRAGKVTNDFKSYMAGLGNVDYDNSDVYYAAHLGYGQFLNIDPHTKMDLYGKYFYKVIPGSNTTTHAYGFGDIDTEFDALTSHKFRVGSKITWDYMKEKKMTMYADLAIEHELSHTQTTNLGGRTLSNSSGADTTGVLEVGYRQVFGPKDAFMFTADLQGYVGTRKGIGGNVGIRFNF